MFCREFQDSGCRIYLMEHFLNCKDSFGRGYINLVYAENLSFPYLIFDKLWDLFCFCPETAGIYKSHYRGKGKLGESHRFYFLPNLPREGNTCRFDDNNVRRVFFFKGLKGILHAYPECAADTAACEFFGYNSRACKNIPIKSDLPNLVYTDCSLLSCIAELPADSQYSGCFPASEKTSYDHDFHAFFLFFVQ